MKLGNIVSQHELRDYSQFNLFKEIGDVDNNLPTLIVGFTVVKELYPNYDVLERQIDDNTFWTLSIREKREIHTEDLEKFRELCYKRVTSICTYIYIDPFNMSTISSKKIIRRLSESTDLISFRKDNMIYILSENFIFGLNLDVLEFLEIKIDKLIGRIKANSSVFLEGNEILIEYVKDMEYLNNEVMYIPLLYSINNEK